MPTCEELFQNSLCIDSHEWTKNTLSGIAASKGVLLFTNAEGRPIQLLQAASLRRTAQAKLLGHGVEESTAPSRRTDISELTARIYWTCCYNNFDSQMTYIRLAHEVFQENANDWIQLPRPAFSVIEMNATLPYFYVSSNPKTSDTRNAFGLFARRKTAGQFCETLNTVFGLCRNPALVGTGNETSCPYLQMQTCPGPCVGKLKMETYHQFVADALAVANGDIDTALAEKTGQMKTAAQSMHYERAKRLKDQIGALENLKSPAFRWTTHLEKLAVLHIDRANKIKVKGQRKHVQQYAAWKVTAKDVYALGQCSTDDQKAFNTFLKDNWNTDTCTPYAANQSEHLGALALFLFRNNRQGFWEDCSNGLIDPLSQNNNFVRSISHPSK